MITGVQIRAARAYLDWTRIELGAFADVSPHTVKNCEIGGFFDARDSTLKKIAAAFERQGLEFIEGGVRKKTCSPA